MAGIATLTWLLGVGLVEAQVYHFVNTPVPAAYSLSTHYMFYVYSEKDAPAKSGASPTVEFRQLMSKKSGSTDPPAAYDSVEVSLLPYDQFWTLVNRERFCSTTDDVRNRKADMCCKFMLTKPKDKELSDIGVRIENAPFMTEAQGATKKTTAFPITATGRYILTFTNCGNFSQATVSGSIAVKNPYGYLPAYEFFTMRLFGWLTVCYLIAFIVWFGAMVRYYQGLFYIQKGICTILILCVMECFFTWLQYQDWNTTGERRDMLFVTSLLFYTLKYVLSWRLILLASLGAGVVLQDLDTKTTITFFLASTLFLVQSCMWKLIMAYRYSHALETGFLLMITIPGVLIYMVMFMWTFFALTSLIQRITEQKQDELAQLFSQVRMILAGGLAVSFVVMLLQVIDVAQGGSLLSWEYQWLTVDGAPQFGFMLVMAAMMVVWWPQQEGWKFGYMVQQNEDETGELAAPEAVFDEEDDRDRKKKKNIVAPEPIGAPDEVDEENGEDGKDRAVLL